MTLGQSHDTPLGHGQQLCEILSRSNMEVRNYYPKCVYKHNIAGKSTYFPIYTSKYAKTMQISHPKNKNSTNYGPFPWQRNKIIAYFQYAFL